MKFSLMTLGTASALPTASRYPSAHILTVRERLFLIDCGESAQMQIRKAGVSLAKIDNILISHLHGDHVFGLFGLLSTLGMAGRQSPLYIYAPEKLSEILDFFKKEFGEGVKYEIVLNPVKCTAPVKIYENRVMEIFAFPLRHREETYGYLFREKQPKRNIVKEAIGKYDLSLHEIARLKKGEDIDKVSSAEVTYIPYTPRSFAYCSDTAPFKALPEWIAGVDLLYHEATFTGEYAELAKKTFHSTAADAARCAALAGAKRLVLGHFSSRFKSAAPILKEAKAIFKESCLAKEGAIFDIPLQKAKL